MPAFLTAVIPILILCLCGTTRADDWPQWLGPQRDGIWRETGIVERFPDDGPPLRWSTALGSGYSGPAVADGRVIVMDRMAQPGSDKPRYLHKGEVPQNRNFVRQLLPGAERVVCLNETDGELLWTHEYDCPYSTVATYAIGPRATPTIDDDRVYTIGAEGNLFCLKIDDGTVVWSKDYRKDYGLDVPDWGFVAPPLVDDDRLICTVGGEGTTCVAFDKHTGRELWRALSAKEPGYSAPVIHTIGGVRQLIIWDSDAVHGLNPKNGNEYWAVEFPSTFSMSVATPQLENRFLFVMCFNGKSAMITISDDGRSAEMTWEGNKRLGIDGVHNTPVLVDGFIYGCGSSGRYMCARLDNGIRQWSSFVPASAKRPIMWGNVFTIRHDDRFFLANDVGELIIAEMNPNGYSEISRAQLIEPTHDIGGRKLVWSHPAFANRSVYLRNDREIRCYSLAAEDTVEE